VRTPSAFVRLSRSQTRESVLCLASLRAPLSVAIAALACLAMPAGMFPFALPVSPSPLSLCHFECAADLPVLVSHEDSGRRLATR
jgi:hypothetical protein